MSGKGWGAQDATRQQEREVQAPFEAFLDVGLEDRLKDIHGGPVAIVRDFVMVVRRFQVHRAVLVGLAHHNVIGVMFDVESVRRQFREALLFEQGDRMDGDREVSEMAAVLERILLVLFQKRIAVESGVKKLILEGRHSCSVTARDLHLPLCRTRQPVSGFDMFRGRLRWIRRGPAPAPPY